MNQRGRHRRAAWSLVAISVAIVALFCQGCQSCAKSDVLARLEKHQQTVERDFAAHLAAWKEAELGAEFRLGDGVRTARSGEALLALSDDSKLLLKSATTVRFLNRKPVENQHAFNVEAGEALLEVGSDDIKLHTALGIAELVSGTRVTLTRVGSGLRYGVIVGLARVEKEPGQLVEVRAGDSLEVGIGTAVVQQPEDAAQPTSTEAVDVDAGPAEKASEILATADKPGAKVRTPGETDVSALPTESTPVEPGSTLLVPAGTRVTLDRGSERVVVHGDGDFAVGGAGSALVRVRRGKVTSSGGSGKSIVVPGGTIRLSANSRAEIEASGKQGTSVDVKAGRAEIATERETERLKPGERARLSPDGKIEVLGRGPARADFYVMAGESFAVHDPRPPTNIGFRFGKHCPEGGIVELLRAGRAVSFTRGNQNAILAVPRGAFRHRLRCLTPAGIEDKAALTGGLTVVQDSGLARLPRSAPASRVDTDGRKYTVLYQNRLPSIFVRWPDAPEASSYQLAIQSPGSGSRQLSLGKASHAFREGELHEGTHQLTFRANGSASKSTTVQVRFDNAAPKASIQAPADGSFAAGAEVRVAGVVVRGWSVSVGGQRLPLDRQLRFDAQVATSSNQGGIAIQLIHPRRGVHYYVRHAAGAD